MVIVAALDGTFERKGFNNILNLVPYAESVVKLSAVCNYCKCEAHFTKRTSDDTEVEVSSYFRIQLSFIDVDDFTTIYSIYNSKQYILM